MVNDIMECQCTSKHMYIIYNIEETVNLEQNIS